MYRFLIAFQILLLNSICYSQTVVFSDLQLKQFLVTEKCIDTDNDGFADINADFNNDGQIQFSEADSISRLYIGFFPNTYAIKSLQDIGNFHNLQYLRVLYNDSLIEVSNIGLANLDSLWVGSNANINKVDISDLTGLTYLRIEDCDTLDYLNIQNGSVAQYFSMFYCEPIRYACVDSIADEYNEVAWRMLSEPPSVNCILSIDDVENDDAIFNIFPNPTHGALEIISSLTIEEFLIFNSIGVLIADIQNINNQIDISHLNKGIYFIGIQTKNGFFYKKILKN